MKSIRIALFALVLAVAALPSATRAGSPYETAAYKEALASGKTVVLDFHATWCGTCRKQAKSLGELESSGSLGDAAVFTVNFDAEKDLKKELGVKSQSTVVVFRDGKEVSRATGVTSPAALRKLIAGEK